MKEKVKPQDYTDDVVKEVLLVNMLLMSTPRLFDDLIYDLEGINKYRHRTKQTIKKMLHNFEKISDTSYVTMNTHTLGDELCDGAMEFYEKAQEYVLIEEGVPRSANILLAVIAILKDKFKVIDSIKDARQQLHFLQQAGESLVRDVPFKSEKAVKAILIKHCSKEMITLVSDK